jgi:hypothetical protein
MVTANAMMNQMSALNARTTPLGRNASTALMATGEWLPMVESVNVSTFYCKSHYIFKQILFLVCDCHEQADTCHRDSGNCFCNTRGVRGEKCDT